jgi:hypothetical protein
MRLDTSMNLDMKPYLRTSTSFTWLHNLELNFHLMVENFHYFLKME